jgi:hypothetical protein
MDTGSLSDDELVEQVLTWAARIARGEAEHLELVAELDERRAWAEHGVRSCAHWLSWKLGWSSTTARERCRVGRALRSVPRIAAAFKAGQLSYSQVRAATRVATAEDEQHWLDLARVSTGAQLDRVARGAQRARAAERDPTREPAKTGARVDWDDDGDLVLTLRIPAHVAPAVLAALEQHQAAEQTDRDAAISELVTTALEAPVRAGTGASAEAPEVDLGSVREAKYLSPLEHFPYVEPPYPISEDRLFRPRTAAEETALERWRAARDHARAVRNAWEDQRERLLVEAAARRVPTGRATLADGLIRLVTRPAGCEPVTVQLLTDPLSGWGRTARDEFLPSASVERLVQALPLRPTRGPAPLELACHDQGRDTRLVTPALRRLIGQVDGERCRFPGCLSTRNLHAHHVTFWRHEGRTDLANLVLLCTRHHRLLHDAGYELTLHPDRALTVRCPGGQLLAHQPELPEASAEALPPAGPFITGYRGDPFDLGYVVTVMLAQAA